MQDDNVLPNDGTFFGGVPLPVVEQEIDRKKEKAKALEALTVIATVLDHFQTRIDHRDSLDSIKVDLEKDPELHQKMCSVNSLLKLALQEEKDMLEELLEVHAKNR